MTDNVSVTPGNGATIATDNISGYHYQRVKVTFGVDGAATDVSASDPLPVTGVVASITAPIVVGTLPALVAGSAIIGKVGLDQTTPGTTNKVSIGTDGTVAINAALPAGTALIGKTGIDQTTPGTTNAVSLAQVGSTTVATGNGVVGAGVQRVAIASDNTTFPVTATLAAGAATIGALTANQSVNVAQMNGVAVTMGSGVTGTGVQRVVLATDVALPTGSNTIGALTANQSVNNAQIAGVATSTGNGVVGTGVQRVAIASDNTAFSVNATLATGSNTIGALTANQSVNNAQIAGVATATGNGVTGTGSQRVTVASDNTPFPVKIDQTAPGTTNAVNSTPATPTPYSLSSANTTNLATVKASAGTLYTVAASNNGAAAAFLKLYNLAVNPTLASSVPTLIVPIPASSVVSLNLGTMGHRFATGIAHAITNLVGDTDATAVAAAQVKVILDYI